MEALKTTLTDNALIRYYELRIKYLENENEKLRNEARADFLTVLDFWIYAQRTIETYVMFHKESNHEHYIDVLITMLETLEAHDKKALDTAINNLRLEVISRCKDAIIKCQQITAAR